jgi:transcription antitermination factor NusG
MQGRPAEHWFGQVRSMPSWYVLRTQSKRELAAHEMLRDRGITSMVPMEHRLVRPSRHSKRRELRSRPLMFGYLFLRAEAELPWQEIRDVPDIRGFIAQDGEPYALPPSDVERLLSLSSVSAADNDPDKPIRPGDEAVIISGPFAGRTIKVDDIVGQRVRMLMEIFGSTKIVELPVAALAPTSGQRPS